MRTALLVLLLATRVWALSPTTVTLATNAGKDYRMFADQYARDVAEQTLANVKSPEVAAYLRAMGAPCASALSFAWNQLPVIYRRLDAVNQYRGRVLNGGTWRVTDGGRHYQIEYYILSRAQSCSTGSGKARCAATITPDLLALLNLRIANGVCVKNPVSDYPTPTATLAGLVVGKRIFPILDAASEAALQTAESAHAASMCGMPPSPISVQDAQAAYIALASSIDEAHFRTPQPFKGGCDPAWSPDECCMWKRLEHVEYAAWAHAERMGRWGEADCFGERHAHVHVCANLYGPYAIRLPACVYGTYPDDTPPTTCQAYLASFLP